MEYYIPQNNEEKILWARNFKDKFPAVGAEHGFSEDEIARVVSACESIIFAVTVAERGKTFAKVCMSFRNSMLNSKEKKAQTVPFFTMPDVPETLFPYDAVKFLQKTARRLKAQDTYSPSIGVNLRIVSLKGSPASLIDAEPKAKLKSLLNSVVRIDWTKGKFDGVIVESKRGDETEWTVLDRDNYSPYIDTRPPLEAGKPEIRYYRFVYIIEDKKVGKYSPVYTQVTTP